MDNQRSILIVEDDVATQTLLHTIFKRRGFATTVASDGGRAMELLEEHVFDLVILDLMMPTVGGVEVLERMSRSKSQPPVIVCTAAGPRATAGLPEGAVILRKPFEIGELEALVNAALGIES